MSPLDLQQRVAADVAARTAQRPEGVSVMIDCSSITDELLTQVAHLIAPLEYPELELTGRVLFIGRDELGPGLHEVVLEVA